MDSYDEMLLTEPMLIMDGELKRAKIIGRKRDERGELIGKYHSNLYLNTRIYFAEFSDGQIAEYMPTSLQRQFTIASTRTGMRSYYLKPS
jgi:hypothetical protein